MIRRRRAKVRPWRCWAGPSPPLGLRKKKPSRLRLYQQILILLGLTVLLPLGGLSVWLYDVNDAALRQQLRGAAEASQVPNLALLQNLWQAQQQHTQGLLRWLQQSSQPASALLSTPQGATWLNQPLVWDANLLLLQACTPQHQALQWSARMPWSEAQAQALCQATASFAAKQPEGKPVDKALALRWQVVAPQQARPVPPSPHWKLLASTPLVTEGSLPPLRWVIYRQFEGFTSALEQLQHQHHGEVHLYRAQQGQWHRLFRRGSSSPFPSVALPSAKAPLPAELQWLAGHNPQALKKRQGVWLLPLPALATAVVVCNQGQGHWVYLQQARYKTLWFIGLSLVLCLTFGLAYVLGMMRNFRQLIKGIKAMALGNTQRQIRLLSNWATPHELIYVVSEFNRMARKMGEQWATIQKANQELATLDELKSNLIDTVSHELRTPLTNIKGYTSQLLRHEATLSLEERHLRLTIIKQQTKRLERLVEDLLVIPDLENQNLRLVAEPLALPPLVQRCLLLLGSHAQQAVHWVGPLPGEEEPELAADVWADANRLEQVLLNLLENALKYRYPEASPIWVGLQPLQHAGQPYWELTISNPSEVLAPETLPLLFNKFARGDESLTRTTRGSGLGLYLVKALVQAMGGHIALSVEPPQGLAAEVKAAHTSYFTVTLTLPQQEK